MGDIQKHIARELSGWGNYPKAECTLYRPENLPDLKATMQQHNATFTAQGFGRSYGDASLNPHGVINTNRLDRFLAFDHEAGTLTGQAGLELAVILDVIIPHGWMMPVIPGTKHVSLGGMVACDVHGKNHERMGTIGNHITALTLRLASGKKVECSPKKEADLFFATIGGMGMTGVIESVSLQLMAISSLSLRTETKRVKRLEEMMEAFEEAKGKHDYMVGWIDHMSSKGELGRGVFEKADHISEADGGTPLSQYQPAKQKLKIPAFAPDFLLNKYSMALYNNRRFAEYKDWWQAETVEFGGFFHPLDNLGNWNKLYGKRGFLQYQCLLPDHDEMLEQLRELLQMIHRAGEFSFLAVLKYHGEQGAGHLSFPFRGYSLALDFPNTPAVRRLQHELNDYICELGGRVYLAKDATLRAHNFKRMYGENLQKWREIVQRHDPEGKMNSLMAERIGLRAMDEEKAMNSEAQLQSEEA